MTHSINRLQMLESKVKEIEQFCHSSLRIAVDTFGGKTNVELQAEEFERLARELKEASLRFLALDRPVACDLKLSIAAIKIGHDYERIFELTTHLQKRASKLKLPEDVIDTVYKAGSGVLAVHCSAVASPSPMPGCYEDNIKLAEVLIDEAQEKAKSVLGGPFDPETKVELVLAVRHIKRILGLIIEVWGEKDALKEKVFEPSH